MTTPEAATAYTFSLYARQATATSVTLRPIFADASYNSRLILGFGVVAPRSGDQGTDERGEKLFAPFACIVNELEEPEIDRQLLLGNAPMGS